MTDAQAARFLAQAAMGSPRVEVDKVKALGFQGWLDAQFGMARDSSLWDWLCASGYNVPANASSGSTGFDPAMWRSLIAAPDLLRQRVALALLDLLPVGIDGLNVTWKQFAMAAYVDLLFDGAFGNYRALLDGITKNYAMGLWLSFLANKKANPQTGAEPDENYAREVMQLFTIGLRQLNLDGTEKQANGGPIDTYSQTDVTQLARVFTGLWADSWDTTTPDRLKRPLIAFEAQHETAASTFLGVTVPAGTATMDAVRIALDALFNHPNLPPFVSKQLVQRLVTSNPSPAYVARVAAKFIDNGAGVRGDMKAIVTAILMDDEARSDGGLSNPAFGKLREPVMRLTNWARAFGATSASNAWAIGDTSSQVNRLGESMGRSPSVFNWFRPGYVPPNTLMSQNGLAAPEFQITNELTTVAYINFMQTLIAGGMGDFKADYTAISAKAGDSSALVAELNIILASGQLGAATVATIKGAVESITATNVAQRVQTAILLVMAAPEYLVQR